MVTNFRKGEFILGIHINNKLNQQTNRGREQKGSEQVSFTKEAEIHQYVMQNDGDFLSLKCGKYTLFCVLREQNWSW